MKRRDVLKGLAGAAAMCALPRAGMAATRPAYTASRFGLMLDGAFVGFLQSFSGGMARADVQSERSTGPITRKHLGPAAYDDIALQFGTNMGKPLYEWIGATCSGKVTRKSGALVALDANYAVQSSLEFTNAFISEIGMPAADAASKDAVSLQLKLSPESTRTKKGDGSKPPQAATKADKPLLASSFRFTLSGLETVSSKVSKVEAFAIKTKVIADALGAAREIVRGTGGIDVPNLSVSVVESAAGPLYDWHEDFVIKGNNGQDKEKTATLEYLTQDLKTALLTLQFSGVGIFRLDTEADVGTDAARKLRAGLYCEEIRFDSNLG
jgi:phage tail-like protein